MLFGSFGLIAIAVSFCAWPRPARSGAGTFWQFWFPFTLLPSFSEQGPEPAGKYPAVFDAVVPLGDAYELGGHSLPASSPSSPSPGGFTHGGVAGPSAWENAPEASFFWIWFKCP